MFKENKEFLNFVMEDRGVVIPFHNLMKECQVGLNNDNMEVLTLTEKNNSKWNNCNKKILKIKVPK